MRTQMYILRSVVILSLITLFSFQMSFANGDKEKNNRQTPTTDFTPADQQLMNMLQIEALSFDEDMPATKNTQTADQQLMNMLQIEAIDFDLPKRNLNVSIEQKLLEMLQIDNLDLSTNQYTAIEKMLMNSLQIEAIALDVVEANKISAYNPLIITDESNLFDIEIE